MEQYHSQALELIKYLKQKRQMSMRNQPKTIMPVAKLPDALTRMQIRRKLENITVTARTEPAIISHRI
jgi:site-specific recombinase XerD